MHESPHVFKKINNIKIREKLLFSYMLVVFLPVLLVGVILNYNMKSIIINNAIREASVNTDRAYTRVNEVFKLFMDISINMQMDQHLENVLLTDYKNTQEIFESYYGYFEFNNILNQYSREIRKIKIYTYNESMLDSGQFVKITPGITNSAWYRRIDKASGRICWQYMPDDGKDISSLCLTRQLRSIYSNKLMGTLVISINGNYFNSMINSEPYDTLFIDDLGNIYSARDKSFIGRNIKDTQLSMLERSEDGVHQIDYAGEPVKAIVKSFKPALLNDTFQIISLVPISTIEKQTENSALLTIVIMASSLLLAVILILIFSGAISKRIKILSRDMHTVAMGNFELSTAIDGEDEIGQLSKDLKIMTNSIKELVQEIYDTKAQKDQLAIKQKEIKLKMLANQINPHFLFNALETIRMKAHCRGEAELADVVKLLGKIMRRNLEIGNEMVTIESEIDLVKCYLEIQKFRYGDRINYEIVYESDDIGKQRILPLVVQPLVENAVVHGLESKEGEGHVMIRLMRKGSDIIIIVQDDGLGMTDDKLNKVLTALDETEDISEKRIGLKNVHQRLKLFYGDEYGLRISSVYRSGTRIEIQIPGEEQYHAEDSCSR